jgi:hypothetical protein
LNAATWHSFYGSDAQGVFALVAVPLLWLAYRALYGRPGRALWADAAGFVDAYAVLFAIETVLDPIATGPLLRMLGVAEGAAGTAVLVLFVLLGDFRVYLLVFGLLAIARGGRWPPALPVAAGATLVVPVFAYALDTALHAVGGGLGTSSIWIVYEVLFTAVALALRNWVSAARAADDPRLRAYVRALLAYVAAYYALWASADLLIRLGGLDVGWLLRVVPNQLYYAFWVPVVFFGFFSRR